MAESIEKQAMDFAQDFFHYSLRKRRPVLFILDAKIGPKPESSMFTESIGKAIMFTWHAKNGHFKTQIEDLFSLVSINRLAFMSYAVTHCFAMFDEEADDVFERLLEMSAFILELVSFCYERSFTQYMDFKCICWTEIFIYKYSTIFFREGGWSTLENKVENDALFYDKLEETFGLEKGITFAVIDELPNMVFGSPSIVFTPIKKKRKKQLRHKRSSRKIEESLTQTQEKRSEGSFEHALEYLMDKLCIEEMKKSACRQLFLPENTEFQNAAHMAGIKSPIKCVSDVSTQLELPEEKSYPYKSHTEVTHSDDERPSKKRNILVTPPGEHLSPDRIARNGQISAMAQTGQVSDYKECNISAEAQVLDSESVKVPKRLGLEEKFAETVKIDDRLKDNVGGDPPSPDAAEEMLLYMLNFVSKKFPQTTVLKETGAVPKFTPAKGTQVFDMELKSDESRECMDSSFPNTTEKLAQTCTRNISLYLDAAGDMLSVICKLLEPNICSDYLHLCSQSGNDSLREENFAFQFGYEEDVCFVTEDRNCTTPEPFEEDKQETKTDTKDQTEAEHQRYFSESSEAFWREKCSASPETLNVDIITVETESECKQQDYLKFESVEEIKTGCNTKIPLSNEGCPFSLKSECSKYCVTADDSNEHLHDIDERISPSKFMQKDDVVESDSEHSYVKHNVFEDGSEISLQAANIEIENSFRSLLRISEKFKPNFGVISPEINPEETRGKTNDKSEDSVMVDRILEEWLANSGDLDFPEDIDSDIDMGVDTINKDYVSGFGDAECTEEISYQKEICPSKESFTEDPIEDSSDLVLEKLYEDLTTLPFQTQIFVWRGKSLYGGDGNTASVQKSQSNADLGESSMRDTVANDEMKLKQSPYGAYEEIKKVQFHADNSSKPDQSSAEYVPIEASSTASSRSSLKRKLRRAMNLKVTLSRKDFMQTNKEQRSKTRLGSLVPQVHGRPLQLGRHGELSKDSKTTEL